ncbi:MAG: hybrid sensor histidine kinase/response regulator, partial [Isosphaeraceae bacterium]
MSERTINSPGDSSDQTDPVDIRRPDSAADVEGPGTTLKAAADSQDWRRQLRASEQLFRATFDNAAVGIAHIGLEGRWLRINDRFCSILGFSREELIGRNFQEKTHPDDLEIEVEFLRQLMADEISSYSMRKRYYRKDGAQIWVNLSVSLLRDVQGRPESRISVVEDVTQRVRAEEHVRRLNAELHEKVRELQAILDTAPVGIHVARDPLCRVINSNRAFDEILGTCPGENISLTQENPEAVPFRIYKDNLEVPASELPLQRAVAQGGPVEDELYDVVRSDGRSVKLLVHASPIRDDHGAVSGGVAIGLDVTALKQAEEALRQADRRKDEFLATLAHELRNPLAALCNGLEILRLVGDDLSAREEVQQMMVRQLGQMVRLIDDLMDVSRISRDKLRLRKERLELKSVVKIALETSRSLIAAQRHELKLSLPPGPVFLDADPTRLAQVLANLLNNAAKYTEPGGHIELIVEPGERDVLVTVRDDGVGIAPDHLAHIFEMFSQVDHSLDRSQGGLGIGLTLVRRLTEMHGGSVEAFSDGPGRGSEFRLRLPLASGLVGEAPDVLKAESTSASNRPRRILIVDDNADAVSSLRVVLTTKGYEVQTAHDGLQALELAADFRPHAVLLDIGLPKINGYDVARKIRDQPWGKSMLLVATTGWGQLDDRQRAHEAGFDHHLVKPVDFATLDELFKSLPAP